jgi:hypothetical protein
MGFISLMSRKSNIMFMVFLTLFTILIVQLLYLDNTKSIDKIAIGKKIEFIKSVGLPDLAIATQTQYIRHRSLSSTYSIYNIDANLREFSPLTFVYAHSNISNHQHSKIVYADAKK